MSRPIKREQAKYYSNKRWRSIREKAIKDYPICQCCNNSWSECVHHIEPFAEHIKTDLAKAEELAYNGNVEALCNKCHRSIHKLMGASPFDLEILQENTDSSSDLYPALLYALRGFKALLPEKDKLQKKTPKDSERRVNRAKHTFKQ